jgi:hypothetical protein
MWASCRALHCTAGDAKKYKVFSSWAKQTAARPRPADPLKPRKVPKKAQDDMAALQLAIRQKVGTQAMCMLIGMVYWVVMGTVCAGGLDSPAHSTALGCAADATALPHPCIPACCCATHFMLMESSCPSRPPAAVQSASAINNIADALAAKYGGVSKAGSGAKKRRGAAAAAMMVDEPSEEQFAAAQQRMAARMAENKAPAGSSKGSKGSKSKK